MAWIEFLQRAIDFMEEHLHERITIDEIAQQANVSPFHFQRCFTLLTDTSVGEYLRRRRLTLAANELCTTSEKVIDLAYKYGYDTPEAFSKAFRQQHGMSPSEARHGLGKVNAYTPLTIQVQLKGAHPMKYRIVERGSFDIVGRERTYSMENGENFVGIPRFWSEVNEDGTVQTLEKLNNGSIEGVLGVCVVQGRHPSSTLDYWVAVETTEQPPKGFNTMTVPAATWAAFEVHGPMPHAMQDTMKKIFSEWLPTSGYTLSADVELEVYNEKDPFAENHYAEIWLPVKSRVAGS
ncbi:AraC family transcriptional regulator [Bacillaceae bacterium SIJ1]|uniref:AraC family transcriptional regulator n=1 Tax=Litoribacterium kuwaitense TaxID=1398745 RepID=UPI0013EC6D57|nr:AraC family transcriptional regulator [Litoribacterium kuwaitense]NGP46394.1 AraC family transcriptional regulator [Litoribacterium kuwaitense]